MKVSKGVGGRGSVATMDSARHPDNHFEMTGMNIKKADDGSYVIEHRKQLKKKHDGKNEFYGGYREPETHTAANHEELMAHIEKHFGGKKKAG